MTNLPFEYLIRLVVQKNLMSSVSSVDGTSWIEKGGMIAIDSCEGGFLKFNFAKLSKFNCTWQRQLGTS